MPLPPGRPLSVTMLSSPSNSSFVKGSQDSFTAGNPVLRDLTFKVERGPTSCDAGFSIDLKAYLDARESAYCCKVTE